MPNLHWTIPVARWSFWPVAATAAPDLGFIEPMVRRRLSSLSRIALKVAHDCAAERSHVRVLFASRHGELRRTTDILRAIGAGEPVSPTEQAEMVSLPEARPRVRTRSTIEDGAPDDSRAIGPEHYRRVRWASVLGNGT